MTLNSILLQDGLANGLGRAANHFEMITNIFMACVILLALILLSLSSRIKTKGYKTFHLIMCIVFLVPTYFCFQHEIGHYISGTILLVLSLLGVVQFFR